MNTLDNKIAHRQRPLTWLFLALSLLLTSIGLFALRGETTAMALGPGANRLPQFKGLLGPEAPLPLSLGGRRLLLDTCDMALQPNPPLWLRFADAEQQRQIGPACTRVAQQAVSASAADSYAWAILAVAQVYALDFAAAEKSLLRSALTGPTEAWISRVRFALIENNYQAFDQIAHKVGASDILVLLSGANGDLVAHRYLNERLFRPRLTALLEAQSEDVQARFLALLRQQITGSR